MSQFPNSDSVATAARDHWEVLGLAAGADAVSIKRAFRQQARLWHPDLNGNDPVAEARFKRVNEAYAVLSDPIRRRAWEAGEGQDSAGFEGDPFASGFPVSRTTWPSSSARSAAAAGAGTRNPSRRSRLRPAASPPQRPHRPR